MAWVATITEPELRRLPLAPGDRNPIHDLLDAVGLPWRESLAALESRVGVGDHPTSILCDVGPGPDDMSGLCSECGRLFGRPALPGEYHPDV